jgi:hypothetical protein
MAAANITSNLGTCCVIWSREEVRSSVMVNVALLRCYNKLYGAAMAWLAVAAAQITLCVCLTRRSLSERIIQIWVIALCWRCHSRELLR